MKHSDQKFRLRHEGLNLAAALGIALLCACSSGDEVTSAAVRAEGAAGALSESDLRAPAESMAAALEASGRVSQGASVQGDPRLAPLLEGALLARGIPSSGTAVQLQVSEDALTAIVSARAGSLSLSQMWDLSSGEPRPLSQVSATEG
ncbi:MAG: hypothetical protein SPL30_06630 [Succinivibrio sp.]|jgi:hypothetical protein|nr:hypothetical protein [Succinivibrio sp.]